MKCDTCKNKENYFACDVCIHDASLKDNYEAKTNADRIRAMSDEELAKTLAAIAFDVYNCNEGQQEFMTIIKSCDMCDNRCGNCVLNWLKQPADQ